MSTSLRRSRRFLATALGALACFTALGTQAPDAHAYENCGQTQDMRVEPWSHYSWLNHVYRMHAESSLICLVNNWREANGRPRLTRNNTLDGVAHNYVFDMLINNVWDPYNHLDSKGRGIGERNRPYWENRGASAVAENIYKARGDYNTPVGAWVRWLGSPTHNKNMLDPRFREVGVSIWWGTPKEGPGGSVSQSGATYVMDFGVRQ